MFKCKVQNSSLVYKRNFKGIFKVHRVETMTE